MHSWSKKQVYTISLKQCVERKGKDKSCRGDSKVIKQSIDDSSKLGTWHCN